MLPRASRVCLTAGLARRPASRLLRGVSTSSGSRTDHGYDRRVRFRIVLFDLDGTLIDSGPIILASMQHAVRTVLGREIPPEELGVTIGGQGIVAQMQAIDRDHADELLEVYKEHNDGLHETLQAFDELLAILPVLKAEGRKLGIVTAKRHRTVGLALERLHLAPQQAIYLGDSLTDVEAAQAAGVLPGAVLWPKRAGEIASFTHDAVARGARIFATPTSVVDFCSRIGTHSNQSRDEATSP